MFLQVIQPYCKRIPFRQMEKAETRRSQIRRICTRHHKAVDKEQVEWLEAMDDVRCANSATRLNRQLLPTGADSVRRHRLEP